MEGDGYLAPAEQPSHGQLEYDLRQNEPRNADCREDRELETPVADAPMGKHPAYAEQVADRQSGDISPGDGGGIRPVREPIEKQQHRVIEHGRQRADDAEANHLVEPGVRRREQLPRASQGWPGRCSFL